MKSQKGFTIIELLVVIAIIAVLAAIVLVNVTSYINKGKDAAIKANLATAMTNSAVYFETSSSYSAFCSSAGWSVVSSAISGAGGSANCEVSTDSTKWCACSTLKTVSTTVFCVDSSGAKEETTSTSCSSQCTSSGYCM